MRSTSTAGSSGASFDEPLMELTARRTDWSMIDDGDVGGAAIRGAFRA
ncbi:MAG TPA: hypothetical protein VII89_01920 [Candidatus Dormibacteraeota bacterium]